MRRHHASEESEYNFWQPATDMMSGLVFILILIIALLGLYILSDYTGDEEVPSSSSEAVSSSQQDDDNNGSWYRDDDHGDGDGDGDGKYDIVVPSGGGGGYGDEGVKSAVYLEIVDDETSRIIREEGVRFELYRTDITHLQKGTLQILNTYYPEKISYRQYATTDEGWFYLPEKIYQGDYYFHQLTAPEGYDAVGETYFDLNDLFDWDDPYVVQVRMQPCKNIIRIQMNDLATGQPVGGGSFRVRAAEDVTTNDGTVRYTAGQLVSTITCNNEGYGESLELYLGKYTVEQIAAPAYYTTMLQTLDVQVEKKSGEAPLHEVDTEKTTIYLTLSDELYPSQKLAGVVYTLTNDRTGQVRTVTTDISGTAVISELDKNTSYTIRQQTTLEGYRLDPAEHTVTVTADGRINGESTARIEYTNRMLRISIHTVDRVLRSDTSGDTLTLYDAQEQPIETWTASGSGKLFTGLEPGEYSVQRGEDAENRIHFTVEDTAKLQSWKIPVFTRRSAVALALLAALAVGAVVALRLLILLLLAKRREKKERQEQKKDKS